MIKVQVEYSSSRGIYHRGIMINNVMTGNGVYGVILVTEVRSVQNNNEVKPLSEPIIESIHIRDLRVLDYERNVEECTHVGQYIAA